MTAAQRVLRERRQYNKWVNSQTLEDYALRFTAGAARRWSAGRIANTALGAASFLACEAIGGAITLAYGFDNAIAAIVAAMVLMFLIGLPIAVHAAREGLDIDLLTRGAGFGYLGSTITSLIYASFTFLLFAVEASIMSAALEMAFGLPLPIAHVVSALVVIPIALYGMRAITRFQVVTQPLWLILQLAPVAYIVARGGEGLAEWTAFAGATTAASLIPFGLALSTLLSLLPQIGEQADYLRFLPQRATIGRTRWWAAVIAGGPGWVFVGGAKLALGSFLAVYALGHGVAAGDAANPTDMFFVVFRDMAGSPMAALLLTALLVVVAQMKINVTNAYAGSIAWSNFFSRLTHAHPGRVVWLVFNVLLALLLMELGVLEMIGGILMLYASLAAAWIGALSADLVISKPLGLSPRGVEFKRAYLYDINPVGIGAMLVSILVSGIAMSGVAGDLAQAFTPLLGLAAAFVAAPTLALATRGRFYIARGSAAAMSDTQRCVICENAFEGPDIAHCPAYAGPICSLCCTLETRCHDMCKVEATYADQITALLARLLPARLAASVNTTIGHFTGALLLFTLVIGGVLLLVYAQYAARAPGHEETIGTTLWIVFVALSMLGGIAAWLIVLAHDSRRAAERDTAHQTRMLRAEIAAHGETDRALQHAKDAAEAANDAKTRYLTAVSHEIRSPLNAIYGYSQLLERAGPVDATDAARVIRRSSEHLGNLVEGLLEISRIESGVLRLSRDTVPLRALLDQFIDMFRAQADEKGLALRLDAGRLPSHVRTDEKRFRQIIINLLSNAIKYTDAGFVELRVRYRSEIATIEVIDSGFGIAAADQERIFEPFERGASSAALAQPGIGLGLAITRSLARIMGGELTVASTPGEGSRFTLRLLLPQPVEPVVEAPRASAITGFDGPRATIVAVDDDPAQIAVLSGLLQPLGFDLHTATNGRDGVALAVEVRPALVLMDIQMRDGQMRGGIDGWQAAQEIRTALGQAVRIVMVSANASEFVAGGDGAQPHDAFVTKPVDLDRLLDTIASQLRLDWHGAATPAPAARADLVAAARHAGPFVDALGALIRIGHARGIAAKLDEMEAAHPDSAPLAAKARAQLDILDLKGLARLMESVRG